MAESYKPTAAMVAAAKRGLALREKYKRGGLNASQAKSEGVGSGVARARDIINGNLSLATVKRMNAFFSRHEKNYRPDNKESDGGPTAGTVAWLLWGGSSGKAWAKRIVEQQDLKKSVEVLDDFEENALSAVADAIEDYANSNIPESEDAFGKFMYFAELLRNDHADVVEEDLELLDTEYKSKLLEIIAEYQDSDDDDEAIYKSYNEELMQATYVCMIPGEDLHGESVTVEEIRKAKESFNKSPKRPNLFHKMMTNSLEFIESYQTPADMSLVDVNGVTRQLPKGTWLVTTQAHNEAIWKAQKSGVINGVSIGAIGRRVRKEE